MKQEQIAQLFYRFEQAIRYHKGLEYWSARNLQEILGYTKWENFFRVIEKAQASCEKSGSSIDDHFAIFKTTIGLGSNAQREIEDIGLTRYACYLIAQNGDPAKTEVAFAQTYFAVQTRKQEIIEKRLLDVARVTAREKLSKSEKKLSAIIYERGVDEKSFSYIRSKGDAALFGGYSTSDMKRKLRIKQDKPLADFLPTLTIKAKDFATELTSHNVVEKDLQGEKSIAKEHVENNTAVRNMLIKRGVKPENLPAAEDIRIVKKRLTDDQKKVMKSSKPAKKTTRKKSAR